MFAIDHKKKVRINKTFHFGPRNLSCFHQSDVFEIAAQVTVQFCDPISKVEIKFIRLRDKVQHQSRAARFTEASANVIIFLLAPALYMRKHKIEFLPPQVDADV